MTSIAVIFIAIASILNTVVSLRHGRRLEQMKRTLDNHTHSP